MTYRIIVGPTDVVVKRHGVSSKTRSIGASDTPEDVRAIGAELWETIRPFVSWLVWKRHLLIMARQRRLVSVVSSKWPGPYFAGPRPDLIAQKPWEDASYRQWRSLPHGVVSRLLRFQK